MSRNLILFIFLICLKGIFAQISKQNINSVILSQEEIKRIFNDSIKKKFGIDYPVFRVYKFSDASGEFYTVLSEKSDTITSKDTLHYKIKAFHFKNSKSVFEKKWEVNDFIMQQTNGNGKETSIWFWTKYTSFTDLDKDGLIDPVLVYGTSGTNGSDDGRVKILVFYKGQKSAIRHQNGVLDFERNTQVDETFYLLPNVIQDQVKNTMQKIHDHSHAIFPYGWQEAMKKHKTKFHE